MAEIDGTNPLSPVWPQRPTRKVDDSEKSKDERPRPGHEKGKPQQEKKNDDGDGSLIDEYV